MSGNNGPTLVGWGRTTNRKESLADIQQKLEMPVRNNEDCLALFNKLGVKLEIR